MKRAPTQTNVGTQAASYEKRRPGSSRRSKRASQGQFPFVAAGRSDQGTFAPVSERHDEALDEAHLARKRR